jgi:hypothetical protein
VVTAHQKHDDDYEGDDEGDDPGDLRPAWSAGGRSGPHIWVVAGIGVTGRVNHVHLLSSRGQVYETSCHCPLRSVLISTFRILEVVPKLWNDTIEAHRREVRDATLDTTVALVAEHGLRSVTMSQIAEGAGIGRATLYKYFSGFEAILVAWHERQVNRHLEHLTAVRDQAGDAGEQLEAVLEAYALVFYEHHGTELAALLHRGEHVARASGSSGTWSATY